MSHVVLLVWMTGVVVTLVFATAAAVVSSCRIHGVAVNSTSGGGSGVIDLFSAATPYGLNW